MNAFFKFLIDFVQRATHVVADIGVVIGKILSDIINSVDHLGVNVGSPQVKHHLIVSINANLTTLTLQQQLRLSHSKCDN